MRFKDFITRQRVSIFIVGLATFVASLIVAHIMGFATLWGELFVDLAASAITVVFTALIIDYLGVKEEHNKTMNAAGLAEDEIKATCFRLKWRLARLFGLEQQNFDRNSISSREQARHYLDKITAKVDTYLNDIDLSSDETMVDETKFPKYLERLQSAQTELEQTLILYEYAMSYSLRERVLSLRSELQVADHILGFIDNVDSLSPANISLIRVTAQSIYQLIEAVLGHDSHVDSSVPINEKDSRLA